MTPNGISAHLPIMNLSDGYILAKIFCWLLDVESDGASTSWHSLYLLLLGSSSPSPFECRILCYHRLKSTHPISLFIDQFKSIGRPRLVAFSPESLMNISPNWMWEDIRISPRSPYRPIFLPDLQEHLSRLTLSPAAPFRIKPSTISALGLSNSAIELVSISPATSPSWSGRTPLQLIFRGRHATGRLLLVLGRCNRQEAPDLSDIIRFSNHAVPGPHFIVVQILNTESDDISHDCKRDHVKAGTRRIWNLEWAGGDPKIGRAHV